MNRLVECRSGDEVKILSINAGRGAMLNLSNLGLQMGNVIKFLRKSPFRGPVLVMHQGTEIAIGFGLAQKIFVEKISH